MFGTGKIKKIIIAAIGIAIVGITGCSLSPSGDASDALSADGTVGIDSGLWGDGDEGSVDVEDGEIVVETDEETDSAYDAGSNSEGNPTPSGECSYAEHSIEGLVSKVADFGDEIDIPLSVAGGSSNFYWYDPSSNLPEGLNFTAEGSSASISGTVADFAEPGDYTITIKVTDLDCSRSAQDTVTIKINKPKPELDWVPPDMVVTDPKPPTPSNNTVDESEYDFEKNVARIRVRIDTADVEGAGTDEDIYIKFRGLNDSILLDNPDRDDHERGTKHWHSIVTGAPYSRHELRYFKIIFRNAGTQRRGRHWLLQGIKIEYLMNDGTKELAYINPCILRWLASDGDYLEFGPNDQAVCTVIRTGIEKNAGTNNYVLLEFPGSTIRDVGNGESIEYDMEGGHFGEMPDSESLFMSLNWEYNDFQSGDQTSYGEYSFDKKFFVSTERDKGVIGIRKESDNPHGGWFLESIRVYIWNPAVNIKYGDDCRVGFSCKIEIDETLHVLARNPRTWIEDETSLEVYWKVSNEDSWSSTFTRSDFNNMGSYR